MTSNQLSSAADTALQRPNPQFMTVDGLKIRYAASDAAPGTPILLLSPWPESIFAYLPTWPFWASLGPVIAVDLPGFGHSESRRDVMAPEPMGEFILQILAAFDLHQPHAVGPDVGTPALLFAAANHPGVFKSMIIGGGAADHTDIGGILQKLVNAPSLEPFTDMTAKEFVLGATANIENYTVPEDIVQDYVASYAKEWLLESVQFVRDYPIALPRLATRLAEISAPCQIIVGGHDPFVPVSNAKALHRALAKKPARVTTPKRRMAADSRPLYDDKQARRACVS